MARIEVEVKVHLPHDANGVSAQPGQIITVDTDSPAIRGYLEAGYLYPLEPLEFPGELRPPSDPARAGRSAGASGDRSSGAGDAPDDASEAEAGGEAVPKRKRAVRDDPQA